MDLSNLFSFFTKKQTSSSVAKDRLKLLLIHDRANCSSEILEMLKSDIIQVISNYMEIDTEGLDIQISQTRSEESNSIVPVLYANIPIKNMRKASNS
ncbi:MAG: cell division topological specificity factor MinE [Epulopiscium sp.]|nr:cell division topological specificity factor MinE [Candidatus Epulonipiscium sp.]